ncbi:unnamed protein product [Medioppia subpectinata]|uniref:SCP domain-containing protein n=1 Tax=Medioppia subpectinata TaxID=1979941 RepID=A0A7R9Q193_9ACAR|nr:unnamed protein product [Medioppia subpectinata]CAG2108951.1 unnamed protein product [Medioppia subpectinata]
MMSSNKLNDTGSGVHSIGTTNDQFNGTVISNQPKTIHKRSPKQTKSNGKPIDKFNEECIIAHNEFRAKHKNTGKVNTSEELIKSAQEVATDMAKKNKFAHSWGRGLGWKYGENMWMALASGKVWQLYDKHRCRTTIKSWYDESTKHKYNYSSNKNDLVKVGHFTQLVWTTSRQVGCARAINDKTRKWYVVCHYKEPGNEQGSFTKYVMPLIHFVTT